MKNQKMMVKILLMLSLCTLTDNSYGMMRRFAPVVEQKTQQRFFNPGQKCTQRAQSHWKKAIIGTAAIGAAAYVWKNQEKIHDLLPWNGCSVKINANSAAKIEFKNSKEKGLEEAIEYYVKSKKEDETVEDVRRDILSGSKILNYSKDVELLPEVCDRIAKSSGKNSQIAIEYFQDLQKTFDTLKMLMGIPEEVKIMLAMGESITPGALMGYNPLDRVVFIYPCVIADHCRSCQLFTLIHELTHAQQHMHMGLLGYHLRLNEENEHEANSQAAQAIKCPACMQEVEADQLLHEATVLSQEIKANKENGYLIGEDITNYKNAKHAQDVCSAHRADILFNQQLQSGSLRERFDTDCNNGSLCDRLSTVKF